MSQVASSAARAGLPGELSEFLLDLALAVQRCALYPGGHPSVDAALDVLTARVAGLLEQRELVSLGVARRQLILEGVATEPTHPVLRVLAERLHRHRVAAVVWRRGVERVELASSVKAIAEDPDREDAGIELQSLARIAAWPHIRFHGLTYEQLRLAEEDAAPDDDVDGQADGTTAAQLWLGLAQAALARGEAWAVNEARGIEPEQVAEAINDHPATHAYDQVIVGFLMQLTDELRNDSGAQRQVVQRRLSQVIKRLDAATLDRLLDMGGDVPQRGRFLHNAVRGLRPDAVLELMGAAARTNGQSISTSMLRLLRKLSGVAGGRTGPPSEAANAQLREQMHELLANWSLTDPHAESYTAALESVSRAGGADHSDALPEEHAPEPLRLVQLCLALKWTGEPFRRAVHETLEAGNLAELYALIDAAEQPNPAVEALWERIETAEAVRRLLMSDPVDFTTLDPVLVRMEPTTTISLLLDRLSESSSRTTRMGAFRRLATRGLPASTFAAERLRDSRWYVLRNMLALMNATDACPEYFPALRYARHEDATVRREALQLSMHSVERDDAIALALADADERVVRVGINAAREHGLPARALSAVLNRLDDADVSTDVRVSLIRLLPTRDSLPVLERLLGLVMTDRRSLLRRPRLAPRSPEMLAALTALADSSAPDPRVRAALSVARRSSDPAIRAAARAQPERTSIATTSAEGRHTA